MARWICLLAPVGIAIAASAWWTADQMLVAPAPQLGTAVVIPTRPAVATQVPIAPTPQPDDAATVPLPAPPDAGDDDLDDEEDDDVDEAPDLG